MPINGASRRLLKFISQARTQG